MLVRDVCYGQIPRAARAARHRAAAAWIEGKAGERAEDLADVLAHHYQAALELDRAAGIGEQSEELEAQALRYLALAGERALSLDVDQAERQLAVALELAPAGHPERARCWSAGRRPSSSRAGCRRRGRRSRRPSTSTASRATPSPPAAS